MSLTILQPIPYRVFQRNSSNTGSIQVMVRAESSAAVLEACIKDTASNEILADWQPLDKHVSDDVYIGCLVAPAGGWYELHVRALEVDGTIFEEATVEKVGVGEVFVCAGQSNSANFGAITLEAQDDRVACFDGNNWSHCKDPLRPANGDLGSPWPVLGDMLARQLDLPVAFISVGIGGTSVNFWQPDAEGYSLLKNALLAFGRNGARATLWHQGESDAVGGMSAIDYETKLANTIRQSKVDAGYDIPWFVANVSFIVDHWDQYPEQRNSIRSAQQSLWKIGAANQGPDTDALRDPKYRSEDRVHFSEHGLRTHAERWFAMLWYQLFEGK